MDDIARVADAVVGADSTVALTGAGVSTASGVPSFRGEEGIYRTQFRPNDFSLNRFLNNPSGFWADRIELRETMYPEKPEPNPAHEALAELEREGDLDAVVTQNTDGLHAAAGSERVVELHGNAERTVCWDCGRYEPAADAFDRARDGEVPPRCEHCDGLLKPDVVLFGEDVDEDVLGEARTLAADADAFLAVGSSLTVEPAASLPEGAAEAGTLVVMNRSETPYDDRAAAVVRTDLTEALPALAEAVAERR